MAGELQALLQGERRVIVQHPGKEVFLLKNQRAAEKHGARKFFRDRCAERFELGDQIDAQVVAVLGVPAEAVGVLDQAFEIFLGFAA